MLLPHAKYAHALKRPSKISSEWDPGNCHLNQAQVWMKLLRYSSQYADLWAREISYQTYSQQTKVLQAWDNPDRSAYSIEWDPRKKDFLDSPVVKNLPSNAGDVGLIPGQGTKIPHAVGQLNLLTATREPSGFRAHALQLEKPLMLQQRDYEPQRRCSAIKKEKKMCIYMCVCVCVCVYRK